MAVTLARILDERPGTTGFVVAVCPDQVATQASVRLTSVAIPAQDMGRHAVERLVAKLEGRGKDEVVLIAPALTVRTRTRGNKRSASQSATEKQRREVAGPAPPSIVIADRATRVSDRALGQGARAP